MNYGMNYAMSDISLEDKDTIQSSGRRTFLQFVTVDYLILRTYENIARRKEDGQPIFDATVEFKNPYQLSKQAIDKLEDVIDFATPAKTLSDRIKDKEAAGPRPIGDVLRDLDVSEVFRIYVICLVLQRMLSYALLNPRRLYDFKIEQEIEKTLRASNIYGTEDDVNDEASKYLTEILEQQILDAIKENNAGQPIEEDIKEIITKMVLHAGHLFDAGADRIEIGLEGDVEEADIEDDLVASLFPKYSPTDPSLPIEPSLFQLILKSGLREIIDTLEGHLPDDVYNLLNSRMSTKLVSTWATLFTENQPEIIDLLVGSLPTIKERLAASTTTSETQQDIRDIVLGIVEKFLDAAVTPMRLNDLETLLNNPSADSCLYFFRSLRVLVKGSITAQELWWDAKETQYEKKTGRIKFLRVIHWTLTDEKEFEEIVEYALSLSDRVEVGVSV
jgi:hypothetical protein